MRRQLKVLAQIKYGNKLLSVKLVVMALLSAIHLVSRIVAKKNMKRSNKQYLMDHLKTIDLIRLLL